MFRLALHWQILCAVVFGAAAGVGLNVAAGERESEYRAPEGTLWTTLDSPEMIRVDKLNADGSLERRWIVSAAPVKGEKREISSLYPLLSDFQKKAPEAYAVFHQHGRSLARRVSDVADALGGLFLRLLRMVAVPLVIASLLTGVMGLASASGLGRMFGRTLLYYL